MNRPSQTYVKALTYLRTMLGSNATFREHQWEAIAALVEQSDRLLLVQRTGWGKSIVYFLANRLLRDQGKGPGLLISPLLSLMRNQIEIAAKIGVRAATINSANEKEWGDIESKLNRDELDIVLVSPERLNNEHFLQEVLPAMHQRIGLFVVDEAHCISDWGHDFRPDYRRITRIVQRLPASVPIVGVTATANDRVIRDVVTQLGSNLRVLRGSLKRASLRLRNIVLQNQAERLAWLAENLPEFPGSGIIYTLTVADSFRIANWLKKRGYDVRPYNAEMNNDERVACERALITNEVKALVATVALGMGFDKPDLSFVIHFQRPGSVVAYYQQVGRAGRAVETAAGILLAGREDDDIQEYFIETAFPPPEVMQNVVRSLADSSGMSARELQSHVNCSYLTLEKALKLLLIDGAVSKTGSYYHRTPNPWRPDTKRYEAIRQIRRHEVQRMRDYVQTKECLMMFLAQELSDPNPTPCGRCSNCSPPVLPDKVMDVTITRDAVQFLQGDFQILKPRKQWPNQDVKLGEKQNIPKEFVNLEGRTLCIYGDAGWGPAVKTGKYTDDHFSDELVEAAAELIQYKWNPSPSPRYIAFIPSLRNENLVMDFAKRLGKSLRLPVAALLEKVKETPPQKEMANSAQQAANILFAFRVREPVPEGPCLLLDDIVDSGWTMTVAGFLISKHGGGPVYPFALAIAAPRTKLD